MSIPSFDRKDKLSIFNYSKKLIGHCLRDYTPKAIERNGKGGLGQLVEEILFGYEVNQNPEADFSEAGIELKCTPLKLNKQAGFSIKERLVCGMINYKNDWNKSFEESNFYKKCLVTLLLFYLHQKSTSRLDLKFIFSVLWKLPEKDLLIIRQDYDIIIDKIRKGLAHTLSEGDTMYLGACRKGQKGDSLMQQYASKINAPRRAWCLKTAYMRILLDEVKQNHTNGSYTNLSLKDNDKHSELVAMEELRNQNFDDLIINRFTPYLKKDYVEFCKLIDREPSNSKQKYFYMANSIAGRGQVGNINRAEEFLKAGITMKTIRVQKNGRIKESMSFENIDYDEIYECDKWYDSRLYELFSSRFLFVIFKEKEGEISLSNGQKEQRYVLDDVFFWTMPQEDLNNAESFWQNIRSCVTNNMIDSHYFWKIGDKKNFHIRPKGKDSNDLDENPNGGFVKKYCYWFNSEYVEKLINCHYATL
ncbi:MAG: Sau3AI family type II restriction endonuclease [Alloprevotella sp.]